MNEINNIEHRYRDVEEVGVDAWCGVESKEDVQCNGFKSKCKHKCSNRSTVLPHSPSLASTA